MPPMCPSLCTSHRPIVIRGGAHVCQLPAITIGGLVNAEGGSVGRVNLAGARDDRAMNQWHRAMS
eukprot:5085804-Prymnesium_polylepis.1